MPVPYSSMLDIPPTDYHLLAAKQEPYQKEHLFTKNTEEFSGKKVRGRGKQTEKKRRHDRKSRKAREEIVKWNQTACTDRFVSSTHGIRTGFL